MRNNEMKEFKPVPSQKDIDFSGLFYTRIDHMFCSIYFYSDLKKILGAEIIAMDTRMMISFMDNREIVTVYGPCIEEEIFLKHLMEYVEK